MAFNGTIQEITLNMYGDAKDDKYVEVQQGDSASRVIRLKDLKMRIMQYHMAQALPSALKSQTESMCCVPELQKRKIQSL